MKSCFAKVIGLFAASGLMICSQAHGQPTAANFSADQTPPPQITLNGLTTIFGDRRALFKVQVDSTAKKSYFLAEGQRAGGIELLSVDIRAGKIKVNNHGITQIIALCDPPNLSILTATPESVGGNFAASKNSVNNFASGDELPSGQTVGSPTAQKIPTGFVAGQAGGASAKNSSGATSSSASSGETGTSDAGADNTSTAPSDTTATKPEPYSLTAAREFERLRIQTAAAVYDGIDEPIPLTPLTPPGTPMALIGPDRAWFPD
jgi:hypothetical protein